MYNQEKIKPYNSQDEKGKAVEYMFDNIASTYDTLNHRLSWNIDKYWRKKAICKLRRFNPKIILDVATGTGDFAIYATKMLNPKKLIGIDLSEKMMEIGKEKVLKANLSDIISFQKEDCMSLNFPSNTFDAITVAFGIRNFQDLDKGLSEIFRILKPGGNLCMIELTSPIKFPMKQLFKIYSKFVLPLYGKFISKDTGAYEYLNKTIAAFPQGERMMETLNTIGYKESSFERLTFGICTLYTAKK